MYLSNIQHSQKRRLPLKERMARSCWSRRLALIMRSCDHRLPKRRVEVEVAGKVVGRGAEALAHVESQMTRTMKVNEEGPAVSEN